jgi:hypothetical protein
MKKGFLQISFSWLFAIIVGAIILFFAIFASTKMISQGSSQSDLELSKNLEVLLAPLETGFESTTISSITLAKETKLSNRCENISQFGSQQIIISQKTLNKWSDPSKGNSISNKYLFFEAFTSGKKFYLFAKPFEFPFKVGDLIYLTSAENFYCFRDSPEEIEEEILDLVEANPNINMGVYPECSEESILICFEGNCDIKVDYDEKKVTKDGNITYFEGNALMYAAIFSDKKNYECQILRLKKRTSQLVELYLGKANIISRVGCDRRLQEELNLFLEGINEIESSRDLKNLEELVEEIKSKNEYGICRLW